jgi:hypothetical protein
MTHTTPGDTPATYSPDTLLTLREVSAVTGLHFDTVKGHNNSGNGIWPNAIQDKTGRKAWRVPVSDLVATGHLDPSQVEHVENELAARRESKETKALREQVIRLEEQLTAAVALADERANTIALLKSLVRKGGAA